MDSRAHCPRHWHLRVIEGLKRVPPVILGPRDKFAPHINLELTTRIPLDMKAYWFPCKSGGNSERDGSPLVSVQEALGSLWGWLKEPDRNACRPLGLEKDCRASRWFLSVPHIMPFSETRRNSQTKERSKKTKQTDKQKAKPHLHFHHLGISPNAF